MWHRHPSDRTQRWVNTRTSHTVGAFTITTPEPTSHKMCSLATCRGVAYELVCASKLCTHSTHMDDFEMGGSHSRHGLAITSTRLTQDLLLVCKR